MCIRDRGYIAYKRPKEKLGFKPEAVCADSAYDSSEIHKDCLLYTSLCVFAFTGYK